MTASGADRSTNDVRILRAARLAAERWNDFPVNSDPRPLLLPQGPVRVEKGFSSGAAKIAFGLGRVDADAGVADEVLRSLRVPRVRMQHPPPGLLRLIAAVRDEVDFVTDRGAQLLPEWRVTAEEALGPIWVLTEELQSRCWSPPPSVTGERLGPHILPSATIGPDGQDLVVTFVGGSKRLFHYDAEVIQTPTAVTVAPLQHPTGALPAGTPVTLEGHRRTLVVRLDDSLGGRVLVNLDGTPVPLNQGSRRDQDH